jgi:small-conductance mechanosensitive channel
MQVAGAFLLVVVSWMTLGCGTNVEADAMLADSVVLPELAMAAETVAATISDSFVTEQDPTDLAAVVDSLRTQVSRLDDQVTRLQAVDRDESLNLLGDGLEDPGTQSEGLDAARRVQETAQDVRHFTFRAIWAAILFFIAWLGIKGAEWVLNVLSERSAKRRLLFKKLIPIVRLMVWALVLFYVVSAVFEIDRAGLLAGTAALGVGIGFAAQGVLKNVFGGLIIIFDQPFQVGDKIRVGGTYGEVVSIGMRATRIVTPDDNLVSVPNAQIIEDQVANANAGQLDCQVVVDLYVPGWTDVAKAKAIALNAAINSQYTYLDKPVVVNVKDEFERIFLTHLIVKAYVIDTRYEFALASDITQAAKEEFLRHGMIPLLPIDQETVTARRDSLVTEAEHE